MRPIEQLAREGPRLRHRRTEPRTVTATVAASTRRPQKRSPNTRSVSVAAHVRRVVGSLFRIYRDTRFSHDKTPYKTHVGIRFWHDGGTGVGSAPAFYLHLSPGECFGGGGLYHADPASLLRVRARINDAPKAWKAVIAAGLEIESDTLQRVPAGFRADHPFADDLKRKDHFVAEPYLVRDVSSADFVDHYVTTCERIAPLMRFLTAALGQKW